MRTIFLGFLTFMFLAGCQTSGNLKLKKLGKLKSASQEPIVIMIGIDGLRWDAIDRYEAPTLTAMTKEGVRAEYMTPTMPSKTFVNFYSLATGLYADKTGITGNLPYSQKFGEAMGRDMHAESRWWGGEPIWVTAENQGVKAAAMFWLGSEAEIMGVRPSHYMAYEHYKPHEERVAQIIEWLSLSEKDRPRLLTIYFSDVDSAGHRYGPKTPEVGNALTKVDTSLASLRAGIEKLGLDDRVNYVVVSDHGMTKIDPKFMVYLDDYIELNDIYTPSFNSQAGPHSDPFVHIFVKDKSKIDAVYKKLKGVHKGMRVFKRADIPANWHMNNKDRTGDIFAVADGGGMIFARNLTSTYKYPATGMHGYDRFDEDMRATFIATGPKFRNGVKAKPFENVEVYGIIARALEIKPVKTDGNIKNVKYFMKP